MKKLIVYKDQDVRRLFLLQDNPKNDKVMHFNVNLFNQVMNTCII